MEYKGYAGYGLRVDLSTGAITKEPLDSELVSHTLIHSHRSSENNSWELIETEGTRGVRSKEFP